MCACNCVSLPRASYYGSSKGGKVGQNRSALRITESDAENFAGTSKRRSFGLRFLLPRYLISLLDQNGLLSVPSIHISRLSSPNFEKHYFYFTREKKRRDLFYIYVSREGQILIQRSRHDKMFSTDLMFKDLYIFLIISFFGNFLILKYLFALYFILYF